MKKHINLGILSLCFSQALWLSACTPTVQLETPKDGITINMNVVVDHKISVEMDPKAEKIMGEKNKEKIKGKAEKE